MGEVEPAHKVVVDVDFLPAVAAGLARGVDKDLHGRGQCLRLYVAFRQLQKLLDVILPRPVPLHGLPQFFRLRL